MASNVSVTYNFVAGTDAVADQVDTNFNDVVSWVNTNAVHLDGTKAFTGIPSGPSSDPTTANQLTRKAYVDKKWTVCTSATRPGSPGEGDQIYETDTDRIYVYTGAAWLIVQEPLQSWNATSYTQNGSKTCATSYGWFQRSYGMFTAQARITSFQTGSAGNIITLPTPVTLANQYAIGGSFQYFDSGTAFYVGAVVPSSTTAMTFGVDGVNNSFGITPSFAPDAADVLVLTIQGRYA